MTLTIHHLGISQSERIVFLCEELGVPYTLKVYPRSPLLSPPELKAQHPLGAAPVIDDPANDVSHLAESEACMRYIQDVYGEGKLALKPGEKGFADYLYWFSFANGTLQPGFGRVFTLALVGIGAEEPTRKRLAEKVDTCLEMMDERLKGNEWLAGEKFTAADVMTMFTLTTMRKFVPWDLSKYGNVLGYMRRISEREAYKRTMKACDPELDISELIGGAPPAPQDALKGVYGKK